MSLTSLANAITDSTRAWHTGQRSLFRTSCELSLYPTFPCVTLLHFPISTCALASYGLAKGVQASDALPECLSACWMRRALLLRSRVSVGFG